MKFQNASIRTKWKKVFVNIIIIYNYQYIMIAIDLIIYFWGTRRLNLKKLIIWSQILQKFEKHFMI